MTGGAGLPGGDMTADPGGPGGAPPAFAGRSRGSDEPHIPDPPIARPAPRQGVVVVLLRHARSTANTSGLLAGRSPGVTLDDHGTAQAARIAERLADLPITRLLSSPLKRCRQTLAPLARKLDLPIEVDDRLAEVDYGEWTGRSLRELATEPLWRTVQHHPSAAGFPAGESLASVSHRAVAAIRDLLHAADIEPETPGDDRMALICSHGDLVKAVLADALGMHLDSFQRIVIAPGSVSIIRYTPLRPFIELVNDSGDLAAWRSSRPVLGTAASDAVPGGDPR